MNEKKIARKQKRCQHMLEKETGIKPCDFPTENIAICNAGLTNGLTQEDILVNFSPHGDISKIILLPQKSCCFVKFKNTNDAQNAFNSIHGILNIAQYNKPLYLSFTENVPDIPNDTNYTHPPGLILLKNFINEQQEELLINFVDKNTSNTDSMKHRKVLHYGYEFRYDINNVDKNNPLPDRIPNECDFIFDSNENFKPDQLTINDYQPGQGIPPHVDTHSAFEDPIWSLSLSSDIIMDFRKDDIHIPILLTRRSLLIMSGEARYSWSHGITPRKYDTVTLNDSLTAKQRGRRISFTFRKVLRGECNCEYTEYCDSHAKRKSSLENSEIENTMAEKLESTHVHDVYEKIASHFSDTRHKPWPNVLDFVFSLPIGSVLVDVGCGNGKYLGHNKNIFEIGNDQSFNLIKICQSRGFQAFTCNCLYIPMRSDVAEGVISIAVIHHLANEDRRLSAIEEIVRILKVGGRALIYVWAKNQSDSNYLKPNKKTEQIIQSDTNSVRIDEKLELPVHTNRTQFKNRDILVPWKLKKSNEDIKMHDEKLFLRFYHVFEEGELEGLCRRIDNVEILKSYYDEGNWCVIIKKIEKS